LVRNPWLRLLLAVASLQVALTVVAWGMGRASALPVFSDLGARPTFYMLPMLVMALGGGLLLVLGRDDSRAVHLGAFFFLLACPFTNRWLEALAMISPAGLARPVLILRSLQVDSFFPFFFWEFTREFPHTVTAPRLRKAVAVGKKAALSLGVILFGWSVGELGFRFAVAAPGSALSEVAPGKPSYVHYGLLGLTFTAALATLFLRARAAGPEERRRANLFAGALAIGMVPLLSQIILGLVSGWYKRFLERPEVKAIATIVVFSCLLSLPFTTAYAVLVHRVVGVKLIARRALQWALARTSALVLAAVPLLALGVYLFQHSDEKLNQIFSGNRALLLVSAAGVGFATLRYRGALLEFIDRRFFREQYDARQILTLLVERIRATSDVSGLAGLVAREIDLALHLEGISLMTLDTRSNTLQDPRRRAARLDASSPLALLISNASDPLPTDLEDPRSSVSHLPEKDRHWLVDTGFKMIVPVLARDGSLLGMIGLGPKKSGLPFLKEDRQLLHAIASSSAWVLELALSHSTGHSSGQRRTLRDPDLAELEPTLPAAELAKECGSCGTLYPSYTVLCVQCSRRLDVSHVPYVLPGKFRFEKRIGFGGMGVVYRGADLALGRPVAVKTLRRVSPEDAMRLRREARTAAAVSHEHLAPVYGMETWQGTPMLVLELLEGGTLARRLEKGPMEPLATVELGIAMTDALAELHDAEILHRDVKPSNIGFTRHGTPKLMDFGIARVTFDFRQDRLLTSLDGDEDSFLQPTSIWNQSPTSPSVTQQLVGTLSYLSPEALNGETPNVSFDLWGLAIVLYECLLGRKIFTGADAKQLMARIRVGRVPEFAQVLPDHDESLADFFRSALHRTVGRRPSTAVEMRRRLEAVRATLVRTAPHPPVGGDGTSRTARTPGTRE
jgi:eukaryotic-like serine/threonine-protein kinase